MRQITLTLVTICLMCCTHPNKDSKTKGSDQDSVNRREYSSKKNAKEFLDSTSTEKYEASDEIMHEDVIEKKYGIQWDFCDCIVKNDSIQKAIESANDISDVEFDILMNRFEAIDKHCKSIITNPSRTPEERKTHEQRVKKCLQDHKKSTSIFN